MTVCTSLAGSLPDAVLPAPGTHVVVENPAPVRPAPVTVISAEPSPLNRRMPVVRVPDTLTTQTTWVAVVTVQVPTEEPPGRK